MAKVDFPKTSDTRTEFATFTTPAFSMVNGSNSFTLTFQNGRNWYNGSNNRITPMLPGAYMYSASSGWDNSSNVSVNTSVSKNGTTIDLVKDASQRSTEVMILKMNGIVLIENSTDYITFDYSTASMIGTVGGAWGYFRLWKL